MTPKSFFILFLSGCLYALGFPSILGESLLVTPIISLVILFKYLFAEKKLRKLLLKSLTFFVGFNLTGYYWIAATITEFGAIPLPISILINTLFSLIVMPYMWIGTLFFYYFNNRGLSIKNGLSVICLAIFFTLLEIFIPQQFDSFLGSPWIYFSKYLGFASFGGVYLYSFFSFIIIFEILKFIHSKKFSKINIIFTILFIVLNPLIIEKKSTLKERLNIRVVQANISNYLKIESENGSYATSSQVIEKYKDLSLKEFKNLDLIIWPETAYPYSIIPSKSKIIDTMVPDVFKEISKRMDAQIIFGGYETVHTRNLFMSDYNTAFHISKDGNLLKTYNKQILIPFGETLPFGSLNKFLAPLIKNISFFATGAKFTQFNLKKKIKAMATICYEILKPDYVRTYLNNINNDVDLMINLTNDSWYGKTQEPFQHLFLSKWRAVEFNIPIIRSTNTGITSVIYSDGTESKRTNLFNSENLDLSLKLYERKDTFFYKYGIITLYLFFLIGLIINYLGAKLNENH